MLGLAYGSDDDDDDDDDDDEEEDGTSALPASSFVLPALAQGLNNDDDDDDSDDEDKAAPQAADPSEDHSDEGARLLPSIDDALNAATVPDFLLREAVGPE